MNKAYLLLVVSTLFGIGSALKCYECNDLSVSSVDCTGVKLNNTITCKETENECVKIVREFKNNDNIKTERKCVNRDSKPEDCGKDDNAQKVSCYFCNKDLCNTAAIPSSVSSLVYILPIALFLYTSSSK